MLYSASLPFSRFEAKNDVSVISNMLRCLRSVGYDVCDTDTRKLSLFEDDIMLTCGRKLLEFESIIDHVLPFPLATRLEKRGAKRGKTRSKSRRKHGSKKSGSRSRHSPKK